MVVFFKGKSRNVFLQYQIAAVVPHSAVRTFLFDFLSKALNKALDYYSFVYLTHPSPAEDSIFSLKNPLRLGKSGVCLIGRTYFQIDITIVHMLTQYFHTDYGIFIKS